MFTIIIYVFSVVIGHTGDISGCLVYILSRGSFFTYEWVCAGNNICESKLFWSPCSCCIFYTQCGGGMGKGWRGGVRKEYCVLKFSVVFLYIETVLYSFWERGWVGDARGCP